MNVEVLEKIIKVFDESNVNVLDFENEEFRIHLDKSASAPATVAQPAPQPQIQEKCQRNFSRRPGAVAELSVARQRTRTEKYG